MFSGSSIYIFLIIASLVIIVSYIYDILARNTNIPSVLMLIATGAIGSIVSQRYGLNINEVSELTGLLQLLGIVGIIMIVLEAALDLKLSAEKWPIIWKSFAIALLLLIVTSMSSAYAMQLLNIWETENFSTFLLFVLPMCIMSSAIVIPSVSGIEPEKQEFMVYEATFSDILGIIFFYFWIDVLGSNNISAVAINSIGGIFLTLAIGIVLSYLLVYFIKKVLKQVNYFLIFAILILVYSFGKMLHLSSLIIILLFGIIINNKDLFFRGPLRNILDHRKYDTLLKNFKIFTRQTSFLVRTFFFFVFGLTIDLSSLLNAELYLLAGIILFILYFFRFINLSLFLQKRVLPELFIAPRGLITILLFFSIPAEHLGNWAGTLTDLVLMIIVASNLIMMVALIASGTSYKSIEFHE